MNEKTKLLLDWLIRMGVIHLDVSSELLYQEFLDNNKEQLSKIKNLDEATEVEPEQVKSLLCEVCGHELLHDQAQLNDMHAGCAEKKLLAYCITINGSTEYHKNKKSFYESLNPLIEEIGDDNNNMIHITRKYITNIKYKNLPECEGF